MKRIFLICVLIATFNTITSASALANDFESAKPTAAPAELLSASNYQLWLYRSQAMPKWSFDIKYDKAFLHHPAWASQLHSFGLPDTLRFSASRTLPYDRSQRLFAAFQTSNVQAVRLPVELYHISATGMAASVGWQLGEYQRFNMAVEYEYREVAEQDINSVLLGVQYYF
ncbi:hypothetical protein [Alteromonas lipotrueiana]|mgnify:CR=1 FL=1|uniref:hypothetical protein n=1 Tax=Alteromonas lipotrueiana TaxID=2803815 RepID=UPI001C44B8B5|nr:hypothetical protein [Alteromonas lipotrueiana]